MAIHILGTYLMAGFSNVKLDLLVVQATNLVLPLDTWNWTYIQDMNYWKPKMIQNNSCRWFVFILTNGSEFMADTFLYHSSQLSTNKVLFHAEPATHITGLANCLNISQKSIKIVAISNNKINKRYTLKLSNRPAGQPWPLPILFLGTEAWIRLWSVGTGLSWCKYIQSCSYTYSSPKICCGRMQSLGSLCKLWGSPSNEDVIPKKRQSAIVQINGQHYRFAVWKWNIQGLWLFHCKGQTTSPKCDFCQVSLFWKMATSMCLSFQQKNKHLVPSFPVTFRPTP